MRDATWLKALVEELGFTPGKVLWLLLLGVVIGLVSVAIFPLAVR